MAEQVTWWLIGSNGTRIKLEDIHLNRDVVDVPDVNRPGWGTREPVGPMVLTATVAGTDPAPSA